MTSIDSGVGEAGEDREVVLEVADDVEVRRQLVAASGRFREEDGAWRPKAMLMASIRRGGATLAAARSPEGSIASSSGSDNATPLPRRKVRLDSLRGLTRRGSWRAQKVLTISWIRVRKP